MNEKRLYGYRFRSLDDRSTVAMIGRAVKGGVEWIDSDGDQGFVTEGRAKWFATIEKATDYHSLWHRSYLTAALKEQLERMEYNAKREFDAKRRESLQLPPVPG